MKEWKKPEIVDLDVKFTENLATIASGVCNMENIINSGKEHAKDFYEENKDCIDGIGDTIQGIIGGFFGSLDDIIGQIKPKK